MIDKFNSPKNPLDNSERMPYNRSFLGWERYTEKEISLTSMNYDFIYITEYATLPTEENENERTGKSQT